MDMLVVGMYGKGGNEYIAAGGCSDEEYQTHFALWVMMNSPLMLGCDLRTLSEAAKALLLNADLIAINQDPACRNPFQVRCTSNPPEGLTLVKYLANGDLALGLFNFGDVPAKLSVDFWDLGLPTRAGYVLRCYDCTARRDAGLRSELLTELVPAHGAKVYRCSLENAHDLAAV
jgi:alpha-galactosidase